MELRIDKYMPPSLEHLIWGGGNVTNGLIGSKCRVTYDNTSYVDEHIIVNYNDNFIWLYESGGMSQPNSSIIGLYRYYGTTTPICLWVPQDNIAKAYCEISHTEAQRIVDLLPECWQPYFKFGVNDHYYALPDIVNVQE